MSKNLVRYLVFDIESVADGALIKSVRYPGPAFAEMTPEQALAQYRQELMAERGSDFIPHTFHLPVSVVIGKVDQELNLIDLVSLDEPNFRPEVITDHFWRGWQAYQRPTWVSFNGRGFDLPVMELAAFRYGISVPGWFNLQDKSYEQSRNRYNLDAHLDLQDVLTNYSACRFNGGLNLAARVAGAPGKQEVAGYQVQDLYDEGSLNTINDYCRCDVLDTYFVFLRSAVLMGWISLEREQELVGQTKAWLHARASNNAAYRDYLLAWGESSTPADAS